MIMRNDHKVPISYWKAWRSRESAIDQGVGSAETAYLSLPSYLEQVANENPWSIIAFETVPHQIERRALNICFSHLVRVSRDSLT